MMQHTTQDYEFLTIILFLIHTLFIIIAQKQGIIIPCFHIFTLCNYLDVASITMPTNMPIKTTGIKDAKIPIPKVASRPFSI